MRRLSWAAALVLALALLAGPGGAGTREKRVAVVVVPPFNLESYAARGAVGLLVPGTGSTVNRAGALSSLVHGRTVTSLLGGVATGVPTVRLSKEPAATTIYVSLPPPERSRNVARYPIAIVGSGYHGLLTSASTRIPGLVSIADVAPTVVALREGKVPQIRWRIDRHPVGALARLDTRLRRAHDARNAATIVLVATVLVLAGIALLLRSAWVARAALLGIPAALTTAFLLSAAGVDDLRATTAVLTVGIVALGLVGARRARWLLPLLLGFLIAAAIVLAHWPETNALSVIGPHPDGGGRFFGVTNEVETLLLAPILAVGGLVAPRTIPLLAVLSVVVVGWSRTGADGGGVLVVLAGLLALWSFRTGARWSAKRVIFAGIGIAVLGLVVVGIDAATGGSSHVTHAVGHHPWSLARDFAHRWRVSWNGLTATTQAMISAGLTFVGLVFVAVLRPRSDVVDALFVALLVSLVVNDSPVDVIAWGALVCAALRTWEELDPVAPLRRSAAAAAPRVLPAPRAR
jgi:hypothetical protein